MTIDWRTIDTFTISYFTAHGNCRGACSPATESRGSYQPEDPGTPLKGPATAEVTQPP